MSRLMDIIKALRTAEGGIGHAIGEGYRTYRKGTTDVFFDLIQSLRGNALERMPESPEEIGKLVGKFAQGAKTLERDQRMADLLCRILGPAMLGGVGELGYSAYKMFKPPDRIQQIKDRLNQIISSARNTI